MRRVNRSYKRRTGKARGEPEERSSLETKEGGNDQKC
jgi:hypothetical protein